jgi:hypothetical protein
VQAWQHAQPSGTNRPRGLTSPAALCRTPGTIRSQHWSFLTNPITRSSATPAPAHRGYSPAGGRRWQRIWLAIMARGPHPFPSRTRSLSLAARMVLPGRPGGRVRRRQPVLREKAPISPYRPVGAFLREPAAEEDGRARGGPRDAPRPPHRQRSLTGPSASRTSAAIQKLAPQIRRALPFHAPGSALPVSNSCL